MILLEMPVRDVLRAQQVDRTWQAFIKGSPKLQQALSMRPSSDVLLRVKAKEGHKLPPCTSLDECREYSKTDQHLGSAAYCYTVTENSRALKTPISINPFLWIHTWHYRLLMRLSGPGQDGITTASSSKESWRNMLLTQPPMQEILIQACNRWHVIRAKSDTPGLTLSDLVEVRIAYPDRRNDEYYDLWSGTGFHLWERDDVAGDMVSELAGGPEFGE
ncbi:hypothetical protein CLAFUW4_09592 [Fulvia fulva]|uniref:F-box domain-containing protein n=1 Tax=Passalora fulva TaxID=5499 RepID=A0A9Q8PFF8_PASFU|nr:uncharacterized protein CLAFUR5_09686 [Fulvia fulva]KAK4613806.1 hypothetical protein CLAFUR4_09597 [Fulvia fulva]KAK4614309.1 hypothetical protein CLAFUR0_09588 [Fulvia fulva]UJO21442.1 hypothetical protein CLAFUR5_09686 [Fulvia fulva]WPV20312.1 hypothetical protein CLAFUW4_09592 [Fulvia fulva]WPV34995.1 hypothetical protein CLAFUW7_09593 [Fulvia fulva]